jgi:hypothetical protein
MPNRWVDYVKKFAADNNLSYGCALSKPECKETYRAKYGVAKKLTKKQNIEKMGAEDMDAPNIKMVVKEKKKRKPTPQLVIEEEPEESMELEVKTKPKKVKAVIPIRDKNKDYGGREQLLETFDVKTLRKFLKDQFDYVASPQVTKKELVLNILLAEAGLPIKY